MGPTLEKNWLKDFHVNLIELAPDLKIFYQSDRIGSRFKDFYINLIEFATDQKLNVK